MYFSQSAAIYAEVQIHCSFRQNYWSRKLIGENNFNLLIDRDMMSNRRVASARMAFNLRGIKDLVFELWFHLTEFTELNRVEWDETIVVDFQNLHLAQDMDSSVCPPNQFACAHFRLHTVDDGGLRSGEQMPRTVSALKSAVYRVRAREDGTEFQIGLCTVYV